MGWLLCLVVVGSVLAQEAAGQITSVLSQAAALNYHDRVGIPLAESVRQAEQAVNNGSRITNGSPSPLGAFPFVGGLIVRLESGQGSLCTCSLLSPTRAVTAAHCATDATHRARTFTAVFGSIRVYSGGTRVTTSEVRVHEHYNMRTVTNDIALLILSTVKFTSNIAPVSLPSGSLLRDSFVGRAVQAIGFGLTRDGGSVTGNQALNNVTLEVFSNEACQRVFPGKLTSEKLCTSGTGGRNICFGDSGGPLVMSYEGKPVLVGVSSYLSSFKCESSLAAFVRVTSFVPWIQSNL